jgi:glycosyltransferase involved in cell wall biosynthesis
MTTSKTIWLICPHFPPTICGVGAHTAKIVRELATSRPEWEWHIATTSPESTGAPLEDCLNEPNVNLHATLTVWKGPMFHQQLEETLAQAPPDMILLQYTPHLYDRLGINLDLPRAMQHYASQGIPIYLIAHELFVPLDLNWRHWITGPIQRLMMGKLLAASTGAFISTEARIQELRRWYPNQSEKLHYLAVTTNIDLAPWTESDQQALKARYCKPSREKLLLFWGRLHTSKQLPWTLKALSELEQRRVAFQAVYVGPDTEQLTKLLARKYPHLKEKIQMTGALPEYQVSQMLQTADLLLYPLDDGASTRRGALMAAIQHGIPTVTTLGPSTDALLQHCPNLVFARSFENYVVQVLAHTQTTSTQVSKASQAMRLFFEKYYTWYHIADRLLERLEKTAPKPLVAPLTADPDTASSPA